MNSVVWFEVQFDDSGRAKKFYQDTFGWQIDKVPDMDYFTSVTTESDPKT
ncbi:MAG: VOC family protein, partial [Nitrososphaeraceae archaeon]